MKNTALRNALVTIGSFIFVVTVVGAWTAPTQPAPNGNVSAPITVGADQIKSGALGVAALVSLGGVQIGTTTAQCTSGPTGTAGTVRWYRGVMEYCNGNAWVTFGGGGGGGASPYCAYSGQSHVVPISWQNPWVGTVVSGSCTVSVDATGYQTISIDISNIPNSQSRTNIGYNQDTITGLDIAYDAGHEGATSYVTKIDTSFDRETGILKCQLSNLGTGVVQTQTYTFTKDQSKCVSGGGGGTETDPTVLTSVKDGVSWSEVTGKPTQMSGSVVAGCMMGGSPCWGGASVGGDTSFGGGYLLCPTGTTAYTISPANGTGLCIKN